MFSCWTGELWIFQKGGTGYTTKQLINDSFFLTGIRLSEDKKEIFVGSNFSKLLVYRDDGSSFTLRQTIDVGFQI